MLAWSCHPAGVFVSVLSSIQALGLAIFASIFAPDVPISYVVTLFGGLNDPMQVRSRFVALMHVCLFALNHTPLN
jgi:hypothetical protein